MKKRTKVKVTILCLLLLAALLFGFDKPEVSPATEGLSDALNRQKNELRSFLDNGKYVPAYFFFYDITSCRKLSEGKYEVGITGGADYGTAVDYFARYSFEIALDGPAERGRMEQILNITEAPLEKLIAQEFSFSVKLKKAEVFYYKENSAEEMEVGICQKDKQYYFLLMNYNFTMVERNWSIISWSEGILPENWED